MEKCNSVDACGSGIDRNAGLFDQAEAHGKYKVQCVGPKEEYRDEYAALQMELMAATDEMKKQSLLSRMWKKATFQQVWDDAKVESIKAQMAEIPMEVKWEDSIDNLVTTVGKNLMLDTAFAGSAYTANVFMGLISSVSYGAGPAAGDTMASHAGWYEVSATTYYPTIAARLAPSWSGASGGSKATTATAFSIITNGGTVKGCFIVFGSGAVSTLGSTAGTLYSAGTFTGGDKVVSAGDTLNVTWTGSL